MKRLAVLLHDSERTMPYINGPNDDQGDTPLTAATKFLQRMARRTGMQVQQEAPPPTPEPGADMSGGAGPGMSPMGPQQ